MMNLRNIEEELKQNFLSLSFSILKPWTMSVEVTVCIVTASLKLRKGS